MNKQIEEMAKVIDQAKHDMWEGNCKFENHSQTIAEYLYNADYRKLEWISVDEKLPKHREKVLVCDDKQNLFTALYVVFDNGGFDWCTSVRLVYKVAHWMPLPEAPKMRKEDEGK